MGMACRTNRGAKNVYTVLAGKPQETEPLERPTCRWNENIKMDLKETRWGVVD
jgi:hypothetical protein